MVYFTALNSYSVISNENRWFYTVPKHKYADGSNVGRGLAQMKANSIQLTSAAVILRKRSGEGSFSCMESQDPSSSEG
jgi:hypothetical protein